MMTEYEIKFRGKRIDNGEWVYGSLLSFSSGKLSIAPTKSKVFAASDEVMTLKKVHGVDPATVGQFTGLKDGNGREIYKGDIIEAKLGILGEVKIGPFSPKALKSWANTHFDNFMPQIYGVYVAVGGEEYFVPANSAGYKVIGNIYDNPELLEGVAG